MDANIPHKINSSKPSLPWVNALLQRSIRKKRKLYNRARKTGDFSTWDEFRLLRRKVDRQMRKLHRDYVYDIGTSLQSENTKLFWYYVKAIRREVLGFSLLSSMGRIVSGAKQKVEVLNQQFCSAFTRENISSVPDLGHSSVPNMRNINITTAGVEKLLKNLRPTKPRDLIMRQPVFSKNVLLVPLQYSKKSIKSLCLLEPCLKTGSMPMAYQSTRKGTGLHHLVSLTCIASKQLEHIIHSNIMGHLERFSLLSDRQHGFRSGRSCETQLAGLVNDLAQILDANCQVDLCIMDFSKAFDTVPHQRLLAKFDHLGI
ncbi:uncharacterized protein LOC134344246 [Mobula hypostoma]|uniref:uncharacterized protein LOC134344246 n=1 Tax=Mobula hypostoma TaxID=723540 RepID=UPI002FC3D5C1